MSYHAPTQGTGPVQKRPHNTTPQPTTHPLHAYIHIYISNHPPTNISNHPPTNQPIDPTTTHIYTKTHSPPAYAFVAFDDYRDAEDAIRGRDGYRYDGERLR